MRILISGGGLAGLTLAYWLNQSGFTPVIVEEAPGLRRDGYGIDFFGTGYDVAARMGLIDWLAAHKLPVKYVAYVNADGGQIARLDISLMEKVMYGHYMALMHWTLEEALYNAVKDDVEIRFGCTLDAVDQDAEGVNVTFSDGRQERFDLLIGCDGLHSNTRRLVFGPEQDFGRYMGYYVACYPLPDRYDIGPTWQNYTEPKRQAGVYCSDTPGELITFFMVEAPDEGHIPMAERLPRLRRAFAGMDWITPRLLDDIPDPQRDLHGHGHADPHAHLAPGTRRPGRGRRLLPDSDLRPGGIHGAGRRVRPGPGPQGRPRLRARLPALRGLHAGTGRIAPEKRARLRQGVRARQPVRPAPAKTLVQDRAAPGLHGSAAPPVRGGQHPAGAVRATGGEGRYERRGLVRRRVQFSTDYTDDTGFLTDFLLVFKIRGNPSNP